MRDVYCFGNCKVCKKLTALKNGYCLKCEIHDGVEMPEFFKDMFNGFSNVEKKWY